MPTGRSIRVMLFNVYLPRGWDTDSRCKRVTRKNITRAKQQDKQDKQTEPGSSRNFSVGTIIQAARHTSQSAAASSPIQQGRAGAHSVQRETNTKCQITTPKGEQAWQDPSHVGEKVEGREPY